MNTEACLKAVRCPECKTTFYPTPLWGWKIGERRYCRYSCMRAAQKRQAEKKKQKARALNEKRIRMVQERAPAREINAVSQKYTQIMAETP